MTNGRSIGRHFPGGARVFQRMFTRLGCQGRPPQFVTELFPYAGLTNTIRLRENVAQVRVSDVLEQAPRPVLEAAAGILLARLYGRKAPREWGEEYRRFLSAQRTQRKLARIRKRRTRPILFHPKGNHHDLRPLFDRLNRTYFGGRLKVPRLGWSARPWKSQLGCFDPAFRQIVLSSSLDSERVPRHVVEYVLYHEILHMRHPVRRAACGLSAHSSEFRREERRYRHFDKARRFLARAL